MNESGVHMTNNPNNPYNPIIVQSDKTILLEGNSP